jgi:hypothetical protein
MGLLNKWANSRPANKYLQYQSLVFRCLLLIMFFAAGIAQVIPVQAASSNLSTNAPNAINSPAGCDPTKQDCGMGWLPKNVKLEDTILEFVRIFSVAGSLYFFGGIVINLAQAQVAQGFGDRQGYAHSMEAVLAMVLLLSVAGATYPIANSLKSGFLAMAGDHNAVNGVVLFWQSLARVVVSFVLGAAIMLMMVKVAFSGAAAQFGQIIGAPNAVSSAAMNIATAIGGGMLTILSVWLANTLISKIAGG